MPSWLNWFSIIWPIAVTITPVMIAVGFLWLKTKFAGLAEVGKLAERVNSIETTLQVMTVDIAGLDEESDREPTRMQMLDKMTAVLERMSKVEAAIEGDRRQSAQQFHSLHSQLQTNNNYLHSLVEHGLKGSGA